MSALLDELALYADVLAEAQRLCVVPPGEDRDPALDDLLTFTARNLLQLQSWPFEVGRADDLANIQSWDIGRRHGGYLAAGVGGPITGSGANLLIIGDPIKNQEEADSATYRENVWDWYTATAYTRLEEGGAIIVIQTRWHHDDLAGRPLAAEKTGGDRWGVLHLPAIADDGSALWPEKYDRAALDRIKAAVGSRVFAALYQGRPSDEDTALLKREWWRFYGGPTGVALPKRFDQSLQSWDMTFKGGGKNDFVADQVWHRAGANCYLTDRVRRQLDFPATLGAIRAMSARNPEVLIKLVEDMANGPAVIATLRNELPGLIAVQPEGGKVACVNAVASIVEAGNVWLPHPSIAPWVDDFVEECTAFPTGPHDDEVDAMSQALIRMGVRRRAAVATSSTEYTG